MRLIIVGFCILTLAAPLAAQEKRQILSAEQEPRKMLYKFLLAEAQKHFDARKKLVASLKTSDEIHNRQADLKAKALQAIGGFPDKTPLNAQVVGTLKGDCSAPLKVIYESRPNHHVTLEPLSP